MHELETLYGRPFHQFRDGMERWPGGSPYLGTIWNSRPEVCAGPAAPIRIQLDKCCFRHPIQATPLGVRVGRFVLHHTGH